MSYLATIGLEVHVQLKTRSKMFCACPVEFGAEPNSHTCPICLGLPGALPVMNHEALRMTVLTGLMLGCEIAPISKFDRKNYFYPDMPKNYQISQYDLPLCTNGSVPLARSRLPEGRAEKHRDAGQGGASRAHPSRGRRGRSFHFENYTGIDFNRAGTPLMEIVTEPEINSPEEAFAFLTALKQILIYGAVSDADMEKGQLRCDCNVSVRRRIAAGVGRKNRNQEHELDQRCAPGARLTKLQRQIEALKAGRNLEQETRGWDDARGRNLSHAHEGIGPRLSIFSRSRISFR